MEVKGLKVKVKNKGESIKIQKQMFSFGFVWGNGEKRIQLVNEPYLYFDFKHKTITFTYKETGGDYFKNQKFKEISVKKLLSNKFKAILMLEML